MSNPEALYYEGRCNALEGIIIQLRDEYKREHNANIALSTHTEEMSDEIKKYEKKDRINTARMQSMQNFLDRKTKEVSEIIQQWKKNNRFYKPRAKLVDEFFADIKPIWEQLHPGNGMVMETLLEELEEAYDDYASKIAHENSAPIESLFESMLQPNSAECDKKYIQECLTKIYPYWSYLSNIHKSVPEKMTGEVSVEQQKQYYIAWYKWWQERKYEVKIKSLFDGMLEPDNADCGKKYIRTQIMKILAHRSEILERDKTAPRIETTQNLSPAKQKQYYKQWYRWWQNFQYQLSQQQVELKETEASIQTITTRVRAL